MRPSCKNRPDAARTAGAACGATRRWGEEGRAAAALPTPQAVSAEALQESWPECPSWPAQRAALRAFPGGYFLVSSLKLFDCRQLCILVRHLFLHAHKVLARLEPFFDGRRPARADPRQAGHRRVAVELDRIDQAAFDAPPELAAYGADAVQPHVGHGGLDGPDRGSAELSLGVYGSVGMRLRRPGLASMWPVDLSSCGIRRCRLW